MPRQTEKAPPDAVESHIEGKSPGSASAGYWRPLVATGMTPCIPAVAVPPSRISGHSRTLRPAARCAPRPSQRGQLCPSVPGVSGEPREPALPPPVSSHHRLSGVSPAIGPVPAGPGPAARQLWPPPVRIPILPTRVWLAVEGLAWVCWLAWVQACRGAWVGVLPSACSLLSAWRSA